MIIIDLIYNLAVLIALSVFSGFIDLKFNRTELNGKVLQGLLFGTTAVIGMMNPFILSQGLIFDGRSIVISLCAVFFGPLAGIIAAGMALIYRLSVGGPGLIMGTLVIATSFLLGYLFHIRRAAKPDKKLTLLDFYKFGLLVHVAMLLLVLTLPFEKILNVYKSISFTVIGIYPFVTILIGKILLDQEENKNYVKKLTDNEERLRLSLQAANQGLYDLNVQTGKAIVNEEYAIMLGYDPASFNETNKDWIERLHPDDKELASKAYFDYVEGRRKDYAIEFRQKTKDGNWKWILSTGKIIEYSSDGKPLRMLGTHTDITKLKQAAAALQQSEEKFSKMFRSSPDAIFLMSLKDEMVIDLNEAAAEIIGYSKFDYILNPKYFDEIWSDQSDKNLYFDQLVRNKKVNNFETKLQTKSGEIKYGLLSGEVIELNDEDFVLIVLRDITERKLVEEQIIKSKEQLRALTARLEKIREDERINLSRELHDNFGQNLTALKMDLAWISKRINSLPAENLPDLHEKIMSTQKIIDGLIENVRRISSELRPNMLDYLGLIPSLEWLLSDFRKRTELNCTFVSSIEKININKKTAIMVYRIFQEALTNIVRHSKASAVCMRIDESESHYIVELTDDGVGIKDDDINDLNALGIIGMKERALQFNGEFTILGAQGSGTVVSLKIPKEN